jgi:Tfp pilus assembly protein PilF
MNTRLEQLLVFYQEDPNDPFNLYALAMEYLTIDSIKALGFLEQLLEHHSDYLPTYYQLAGLYVELGNNSKAEQTYLLGIKKAQAFNKTHTLAELNRAYQNFLFDI